MSDSIKEYFLSVPGIPTGQNATDYLLKEANAAEKILQPLIPSGDVIITEEAFGPKLCCDAARKKNGDLCIKFAGTSKAAQALSNAYPDRRVTDEKSTVVSPTNVSRRHVYAQLPKGF